MDLYDENGMLVEQVLEENQQLKAMFRSYIQANTSELEKLNRATARNRQAVEDNISRLRKEAELRERRAEKRRAQEKAHELRCKRVEWLVQMLAVVVIAMALNVILYCLVVAGLFARVTATMYAIGADIIFTLIIWHLLRLIGGHAK